MTNDTAEADVVVLQGNVKPTPKQPRVAVCVVTFQRGSGLTQLLHGLNQLRFTNGRNPVLSLVVVDNDPEESGLRVCQEVAHQLRWPLKAVVEPRRGIPFARNTAVRTAGEVDFIAFIDDDEVPDPRWLDELLNVQNRFGVDVVTGPVVPRFLEQPPRWMVKGRLFERRRVATGTLLNSARTSNVLISRSVFQGLDQWFNEGMALTGGTDTHFFLRASRSGFRIAAADQAIVYEWIPPSRMSVRWILQRAYRLGNTLAICDRDLASSWTTLVRRAAMGCTRIAVGCVFTPIAAIVPVPGYKAHIVKGLKQIWRGIGTLRGLAGHRYEEYKRIHTV